MAVFLAGLVKLWWITRLLKKQEVLDEEKKARVEEMRRTGLPPKRANDIPFGIRAIQSGVEVPGIWISRPESPQQATPPKAAPSVTIINLESEKGTESSDELKTLPVTSTKTPPPTTFPKPVDADSTDDGSQSTGPPVLPQIPSRGQGTDMLSEDTLRKLEGQSHQQKPYEPYVRMSAPPNPRHLSQRSTESSSAESMDSQPRSSRTASGRSYTDSSRSSKLYMARNYREGRATYSGIPQLGWQLEESRDPFGTPARSHSGFSAFSHGEANSLQGREMTTPEPTFGPGDVHVARVARKINNGFEVLPAGTFAALNKLEGGGNATSSNTDGSEGMERDLHAGRGHKKLRKKSFGPIQENGSGPSLVS